MQFKKEQYPYKTLEKLGYKRLKCKFCKKYFWSKVKRDFCDDDECRVKAGLKRYGFIGNPVGKKHSYVESWNTWVKIFGRFGHKAINRYPVVARWRDDIDFVGFSIADFQPYIVSGEVKPPANPLLVPQFCLRFNDLENVGVTGRHYSGFIMIGEHAFNFPGKFIYFKDEGIYYIYKLLTEGFKIPDEEIFFHEDSWEGGGNAGPSIEYFVQGLELGNQVYMQFKKVGDKLVELDTKVIDMGAGLERFPWVTSGTRTSYEVVFPKTLNFLSQFNLDSREKIVLADYTRTLFIALFDGALPSNVSGGYNLRKILRICLSIIRKKNINLDLTELIKIHSKEFRIYPELRKANFDLIQDILKEEEKKYRETIRNAIKIVKKTEKFDLEILRKLYESQGITPEIIKEIKPEIKIPEEFYVTKKEEKEEKKEREFDLKGLPETEKLYYQGKTRTAAKVLKVVNGYVVLNETVFYPRSGGQDCDSGMINDQEVLDVIKQDNVILHKIKGRFERGEEVELIVDKERRKQLMQHHTGAHIINGAVRQILGKHAQQAGAEKKVDKAHLDIFHYKKISDEEIEKIEEFSNICIKENRKVSIKWMNRIGAEQKYGFEIYQGGAVPGKEIRIVEIKDWDTEACGGLHLDNTGEVDIIIITRVKKIQDMVLRIEFLAGKTARKYLEKMEETLKECAEILDCSEEEVYEKAKELFETWKKKRKK
jgi:alanine--tRNA ligase